ncbi:MAG: TetR/AcrR family transcriptional regulator [Mobilitalea sp.]
MSEKDTYDKQNLKNQRVKSYFIQAAKEIILSEGVENVSVRKVADKAGYTFTTLYNYFKDLNELLLEVKNVMIKDVMIHTQGKLTDKIYDLEDIKKTNYTYVSYYIERPHVFRFFYLHRFNPEEAATPELPDFEKLWQKTYRGFVMSGTIKESEVPVVAKTMIYAIHGMLALYFSDNGMTTEILYDELDKISEYILKGRNEK